MPEADYGQGPKVVCDTGGRFGCTFSYFKLNQMVIFNLNIEVPILVAGDSFT